jgi:hypothetical protein
MITDTHETYKERMTAVATKALEQVKDAAKAGVFCDTVHVEHEHPSKPSSIRQRQKDAT